MIPISYNVRSLLVRKTTTIATVLGIALVVFVLASSLMLANGIRESMGSLGSPSTGFVLSKGADAELMSSIETTRIPLVLNAPGVRRDASGNPLGVGELIVVMALEKTGSDGQVSNVQLRGVPENVLDVRPAVRVVAGRAARPGSDEAIAGARLRGRYEGVELDQSIEVKKNRRLTVVGFFEAEGSSLESEIWADVETVRSSFGREKIVSSVTVLLESAARYEDFARAIEHDKEIGLHAMRQSDYYEAQTEGTAIMIQALGSVFVFFFAIAAMIGAMITMYGSVAQREWEIGTLRALGFTRFQVLASFLVESFVLALTGGALGALAAQSMVFVDFAMMNMGSWSEVVFSFEPTPGILVASVLFGGLMGILGGFFPAVRAARISPVAALRD